MTKRKFSYSLPPEVDEMVSSNLITADCRSKNEFVEQAIRFYSEYLSLEIRRPSFRFIFKMLLTMLSL